MASRALDLISRHALASGSVAMPVDLRPATLVLPCRQPSLFGCLSDEVAGSSGLKEPGYTDTTQTECHWVSVCLLQARLGPHSGHYGHPTTGNCKL
jgi:hypothetical protein